MPSKSLSETAYQEIRKRIIFGEYLPGEVLSENGLSKELEMSRTPIRDALHRLDSEGLLVTLKNRGILVKEISYKEIFEISELNNCMFGFAADLATQGVSTFPLDKLQMHLENQLKAGEEDNYYEYLQQSILFGRCIIETTNNQVMVQTYDSFRDKTLRLAMVNWKLRPHEKHYSANQLNSDLYEAIVSKEYEKMKIIQNDYYLYNRERFITRGTI
jgi:DNA-binding GntR family transcriptional regulator